jgi:hypothetical protein
VIEHDMRGLLVGIAAGELESVAVLCDLLEEMGDPRAERLRRLYVTLREDRIFAPFAFAHFNLPRSQVLPLFPEFDEGTP